MHSLIGTHVTGIIGALPNAFGFTGVAPAATLGHYRVRSLLSLSSLQLLLIRKPSRSLAAVVSSARISFVFSPVPASDPAPYFASQILAGLMRGVEDNCNVLTLSLGGSGGWVKGTPASILIDQIEAQGILVTVATGNTGSEGESLLF